MEIISETDEEGHNISIYNVSSVYNVATSMYNVTVKCVPDWATASATLRKAREAHLSRNKGDVKKYMRSLASYIPGRHDELSKKQIDRHLAGKIKGRLSDPVVEGWAWWLIQEAQYTWEAIETGWLRPACYREIEQLRRRIHESDPELRDAWEEAERRSNLPKFNLYGELLPRNDVLQEITEWANLERPAAGVLVGMGGNGKSTIQLRAAQICVHGPDAQIRQPFSAAIWISAFPDGTLTKRDVVLKIVQVWDGLAMEERDRKAATSTGSAAQNGHDARTSSNGHSGGSGSIGIQNGASRGSIAVESVAERQRRRNQYRDYLERVSEDQLDKRASQILEGAANGDGWDESDLADEAVTQSRNSRDRSGRVLVLIDNWETIDWREQRKILDFFRRLRGSSQLLLSSRYDILETLQRSFERWSEERQEQQERVPPSQWSSHIEDEENKEGLAIDELKRKFHAWPMPVDGLGAANAQRFISDYLRYLATTPDHIAIQLSPEDVDKLSVATKYNPKAIMAALGIVTLEKPQKRMGLHDLIDSLEKGEPAAEDIFRVVIHAAWDRMLVPADKRVLMAKAFFARPVSLIHLQKVAKVSPREARQAVEILRAISFFERPIGTESRIRTHPLAQDFAHYILRKHPEDGKEIEAEWWDYYAKLIMEQALQTTYKRIRSEPKLFDDIVNVLERIEAEIAKALGGKESAYVDLAVRMFAGTQSSYGLGRAAYDLGRWDEVERVAKTCLRYGRRLQEGPTKWHIIAECAIEILGAIYRDRDIRKAEALLTETEHIMLKSTTLEGRDSRGATPEPESIADYLLKRAHKLGQAWVWRWKGQFASASDNYDWLLALYQRLNHQDERDLAYIKLLQGSVRIDLATQLLGDKPIDDEGILEDTFRTVEGYFAEVESIVEKLPEGDRLRHFATIELRAYRGVMARVRGDCKEARRLFRGCEGEFLALISEGRLLRELALVEYLDGNYEQAQEYDAQGRKIQRDMRTENIPKHNCYLVIIRLERDGDWPQPRTLTTPSLN